MRNLLSGFQAQLQEMDVLEQDRNNLIEKMKAVENQRDDLLRKGRMVETERNDFLRNNKLMEMQRDELKSRCSVLQKTNSTLNTRVSYELSSSHQLFFATKNSLCVCSCDHVTNIVRCFSAMKSFTRCLFLCWKCRNRNNV